MCSTWNEQLLTVGKASRNRRDPLECVVEGQSHQPLHVLGMSYAHRCPVLACRNVVTLIQLARYCILTIQKGSSVSMSLLSVSIFEST